MEQDVLEKTNRINRLFDFYECLLTEKQQTFLKYYFHDDYSLGEIAEESHISRQAVFEHIKRAELLLEEYESKLQLLRKHERRKQLLQSMSVRTERLPAAGREEWAGWSEALIGLDLETLD